MPWVIDYSLVLDQMRSQGLRSLYYNSGAFGFAPDIDSFVAGWIGEPDATIRPAALPFVVTVPPPHDVTLADLFIDGYQRHAPGTVWLMPKTHWSHELQHGNDWLAALLEQVGIDPGQLDHRTNAAAIEFAQSESELLRRLVQNFMLMLNNSDFQIVFPRRRLLCTLHQHKQIWWETTDEAAATALRRLAMETPSKEG